MQNFRALFADIPDPRDLNAHHDLTEILFIMVAASLSGANSCVGFAEYGRAKEALLRQFEVFPLFHPLAVSDIDALNQNDLIFLCDRKTRDTRPCI